jgi:RNA polymerase sigma-70 factor (ECF subfamily)
METVSIATGGTTQIEAAYRQIGDRLWRALLAFTGDPEIASDAVAEAFAQALRREAVIRDLQGWVWRTSFRVAAGELKRRRTTSPIAPAVSYVDPEMDSELLDALAKLAPKQRVAVILFYYEDAPVREIARRSGTSQMSVRANLSRGRKRLKELLGDRHD